MLIPVEGVYVAAVNTVVSPVTHEPAVVFVVCPIFMVYPASEGQLFTDAISKLNEFMVSMVSKHADGSSEASIINWCRAPQ